MQPKNFYPIGTMVGWENTIWYVSGINVRWLYNGYDYEYFLSESMEPVSGGYEYIKTSGKWIPSVKIVEPEIVIAKQKKAKLAEIEKLENQLKSLKSSLDKRE